MIISQFASNTQTWFLKHRYILAALTALPILLNSCNNAGQQDAVLERFLPSLVEVEISRQVYNYRLPWITGRAQVRKNGVVIGDRQILTTAEHMSGAVLIRVQKNGESRKFTARLVWIDHYANTATLEVIDESFWSGLETAKLARRIPESGNLQVLRWRNGRLEARNAEIERLFVGKSQTSYLAHLQLEATSEIDAAGWSEVVVRGGEVVGLTVSADNKSLVILPTPVIQDALDSRDGNQSGLGTFDFNWQAGTNPDLLRSLGLSDTEHGVVVIRVGAKGLESQALRPGDVLLEIDGLPIDVEGKYDDPLYGKLTFEALATRDRRAGDVVPMRIWRDGKEERIEYPLPRADFSREQVPDAAYDETPEYLIAGGLLFQPLNGPYLAAYGDNAPFIFRYYDYREPVPDRRALVVLSAVMPDPFNQGYESAGRLIVDRINDRPVSTIREVAEAFANPVDGYHVLDFFGDQAMRRLVLDAAGLDAATARVLERYRVPADRHIQVSADPTPSS